MTIFFHSMNKVAPWTETAIKCARHFNPNSEIVHLGQAPQGEDRFYDVHKYLGRYPEMECRGIFGPGTKWYVTEWLSKWYAVNELIKSGHLTAPFIACDWDVLLVRDIDEVSGYWNHNDFTLAHRISAGEMMVFNNDVLHSFAEMMEDAFLNGKHPQLVEGSQDDMTYWWRLTELYPQYKWEDTDEIRGGSVFDCNIALHGDQYVMDQADPGTKMLFFGGGKVHLKKHDGTMVRLNNIHCWCRKEKMDEWFERAKQ